MLLLFGLEPVNTDSLRSVIPENDVSENVAPEKRST